MSDLQAKISTVFIVICITLCSCTSNKNISGVSTTTVQNGHPSWSSQSNIYEVNLRQYSTAGTITEFQKHLPRLKDMGVEILWFMPVTPIGIEGRKMNPGDLGSYYAVRNYTAFSEEYGTMADWKKFVKQAHRMGFKVITDWVANHSAPDNPWVKSHPEFYAKDKQGKMIAPFDWTDVRKLDYNNSGLRAAMIDAMKFWIRETDIDGFRCDVAGEVPDDFWKECITELRKMKNVFMLAEGDKPELHLDGFDETYAWYEFSVITNIINGKQNLDSIDKAVNDVQARFPGNAYRLYFTTNHDENSWNGTEFERMGPAYKAFAVWTQTMAKSVPLIYSGQEVSNKKRLKFFTKDPIVWGNYDMAPFYKTLLTLRKSTKALAADASFKKLKTSNDKAIYAYLREKDGDKVVVMLNLSDKQQKFTIDDVNLPGKFLNVFLGMSGSLDSNPSSHNIEPWGYRVYKYTKPVNQ